MSQVCRPSHQPCRASTSWGAVALLVVLTPTLVRAQSAPSDWSPPPQTTPTPPPLPPTLPQADPAPIPPPPAPPPLETPPPPPPPPAAPAPAPAPEPAAAESAPADYRTHFDLVAGIGVATFAVSDAWVGWGAVLEGLGEVRFSPFLGLRIRAAWGLTEWDRVAYWINHGIAAGEWVTNGFSAVGNWLVADGGKYFLLKLFPAFFAFAFLLFGYVYTGLVFLFSPLAATSYVQVGVSVAGHLPLNNGLDLYAEGGFGTMLYWHPSTQRPRMAFGPVLGIGLTWKELSFGFHGMWSPPALQSESSGAPDVIAASFTVRKVW
ncbi:MAG: hypothetical protein AB1938_27365 [Myxococcota bacterium]